MRKISKKTILFYLFIGIAFAPSTIFNLILKENTIELKNYNGDNEFLKTATNSEKIHIIGDSYWVDLKNNGTCTGEGTISSPYILKNLIIDGNGVGRCIMIENSSIFFRIENCTVYNAGLNINDGAIKLYNVQNGLIIRNTVYNQRNGINIEKCSNILITENNCYNCTGVLIYYSQDIYVYFNNLICGDWGSDFIFYAANVSWSTQQKVSYNYKGRSFTNYLGNYYSLYDKFDEDNNGISDAPLVIDPHKPTPIIVDRYPLVEPIENYEILESAFISGFNILYFSLIILLTSLGIVLMVKRKNK
jgi:parallel beta-helix repeat protein